MTLVEVGWQLTITFFFLFCRKMPPRKPMTRRSPRMPKRKEPKVGEGSTPGAARELYFVSKMKSVIHTSTKKEFTQPLMFDVEIM
jgi:hypothetical protein